MSLQEMVQHVSYVTGPSGRPTAVQVEIELWEQIIALLQQAMPTPEITVATTTDQDAAWDLFLILATDAQPGIIENPSLQHDRYLYGQVG